MSHNFLVVLNGASSSGKTTIAKALMSLMNEQCVYTGLDDILERVQPFGPEQGNNLDKVLRPFRIMWFQLTDGRLRLFKQLHREVVAHHQAGRNVIVDIALMDRRALLDAAECFAPQGGFFVGVKPPLAVAEEWEAARTDRPIGHVRRHYDLIHAHGIYDLELDPSQMTPQACARTILDLVQGLPPQAFRRITNELNLSK